MALRPPPLQSQLHQSFTHRFITTSNFTGAVSCSFTNLLDAMMIATGPTTAFQLWDYVKIRRVTIRAVGPASTTVAALANIVLEYPGLTLTGNGRQVEETMMGNTTPSMISLTPGKENAAGFWQASNNAVAFVIRGKDQAGVALKGLVVDVECSFKNSTSVAPVAITSAVAAATSGEIYFGGIDGARLAATAAYSAFPNAI